MLARQPSPFYIGTSQRRRSDEGYGPGPSLAPSPVATKKPGGEALASILVGQEFIKMMREMLEVHREALTRSVGKRSAEGITSASVPKAGKDEQVMYTDRAGVFGRLGDSAAACHLE